MDHAWMRGEPEEREESLCHCGDGGDISVECCVEGVSKVRKIVWIFLDDGHARVVDEYCFLSGSKVNF